MDEELDLLPCPLCGSADVVCFAEYDGDDYDNEPTYRAVVGCRGCHEEGCDPDYDAEPCFGIEAWYRGDHPLLKDFADPSDCERALERHMAELWNRRADPGGVPGEACELEGDGEGVPLPPHVDREALLELAGEMDDLVKAWGGRYPTNRVAAYARRIREACGEAR